MYDPISLLVAFVMGLIFIPLLLAVTSRLGLYTIVKEREAQVYTLFGRVLGALDEAGLRFPILHFGFSALLVPFFGKRYLVDTALRQYYLRDQMVNSEEGTPMGVGIWYEMQVSDPEAYLFRNANPEGSLQANVASSTISTLSNLEMDKMLEDRHQLSREVRATVSPLSEKWGYQLGSVYIRKVAFTDRQMVDNITEKVVKRLVQVTSAMKQDGENRVGLIRSQTAFKVSQKMAEAGATRPAVVGDALNAIARQDPEVLTSVLTILENEQLIASGAEVDVLPPDCAVMLQLGGGHGPTAAVHEAAGAQKPAVDLSRLGPFAG
ncbi:SPFH domain-containing protein [uncultured Thiodictyon sp.]|uniref:SPFH domain-containing protein n=1 Tax=uncultured Thiodictyon sp. TaxID=1846217 RepID=UPI0025E94773|nr:SPFH domain-containing protein [uncultured Thiodictyon sp.]